MAIIVATDGRIVGTGYNGSPPNTPNCTDGGCPRAQQDVPHGSTYANCVACHAEANALLYSDRRDRRSATLYVSGPPCWDCAKLIASSGISRVVCYTDSAYADWPRVRRFLYDADIQVVTIDRP